ncbi:MAG: hypothetical protein U0892_21585 [Pirellulales bacterium]
MPGNLTIDGGTDGDGYGVHASVSGNILLQAAADVIVNSNAKIERTGHISILAGDDVVLGSN